MKRNNTSFIVGAVLVVAGTLFLLQNLGVLRPFGELLWGLMFAAGGAAFVAVFLRDRDHWWPLIPGMTLLGIGALIWLNTIAPSIGQVWGGAIVLGSIGLSFWVVYLTGPARWWAVIPGGVLLTLALITLLSGTVLAEVTGAILFFGLALTFGLLVILPHEEGKLRWAIYPAAVSLAFGLIVLLGTSQVLSLWWPAVLIVAGLYLAFRTLRPRHRH